MPWNTRGWLGVGMLVALSWVAACTIEVNINTKPDEEPESPIVTDAPEASEEIEAPTRTPAPPAPSAARPAPAPPPPEPIAGPDNDPVRDALFRFRQEQTAPTPPSERLTPSPPPSTRRELRESPTFTPFTEAPSILNRAEVIEAMMERYPPLLREAGIGGTARIYFFIEADGSVGNILLDRSSGHPALDEAALDVADVYRFSPAMNRDEAVPVWVSFPITFQVR
jgi:protein TonB